MAMSLHNSQSQFSLFTFSYRPVSTPHVNFANELRCPLGKITLIYDSAVIEVLNLLYVLILISPCPSDSFSSRHLLPPLDLVIL